MDISHADVFLFKFLKHDELLSFFYDAQIIFWMLLLDQA